MVSIEKSPLGESPAQQDVQQNIDTIGLTSLQAEPVLIQTHRLNLFYGQKQAVKEVNIAIPAHSVTALIGPSGCGKSSFLRCLNRMNDLIDGVSINGEVLIGGHNIYDPTVDVVALRKQVGMVFQKYNPFPKTIFENIAYGPKIHGVTNKNELALIVERSLTRAGLWEEVKDRLHDSALMLSGGQQQRLCVARALAVDAEILLMDEPTSALDPHAAQHIEELVQQLHNQITIVIVTHNMQQAARISQFTGFFYEGNLVEFGRTSQVFGRPQHERTQAYISGQFG